MKQYYMHNGRLLQTNKKSTHLTNLEGLDGGGKFGFGGLEKNPTDRDKRGKAKHSFP